MYVNWNVPRFDGARARSAVPDAVQGHAGTRRSCRWCCRRPQGGGGAQRARTGHRDGPRAGAGGPHRRGRQGGRASGQPDRLVVREHARRGWSRRCVWVAPVLAVMLRASFTARTRSASRWGPGSSCRPRPAPGRTRCGRPRPGRRDRGAGPREGGRRSPEAWPSSIQYWPPVTPLPASLAVTVSVMVSPTMAGAGRQRDAVSVGAALSTSSVVCRPAPVPRGVLGVDVDGVVARESGDGRERDVRVGGLRRAVPAAVARDEHEARARGSDHVDEAFRGDDGESASVAVVVTRTAGVLELSPVVPLVATGLAATDRRPPGRWIHDQGERSRRKAPQFPSASRAWTWTEWLPSARAATVAAGIVAVRLAIGSRPATRSWPCRSRCALRVDEVLGRDDVAPAASPASLPVPVRATLTVPVDVAGFDGEPVGRRTRRVDGRGRRRRRRPSCPAASCPRT